MYVSANFLMNKSESLGMKIDLSNKRATYLLFWLWAASLVPEVSAKNLILGDVRSEDLDSGSTQPWLIYSVPAKTLCGVQNA